MKMKEIYIYKMFIGGWKGISKEEAEEKIKGGAVMGAELEVDRGDDTLKITLLKDYFSLFGPSNDEIQELINEYFSYVEEITGMVTYPEKEN